MSEALAALLVLAVGAGGAALVILGLQHGLKASLGTVPPERQRRALVAAALTFGLMVGLLIALVLVAP